MAYHHTPSGGLVANSPGMAAVLERARLYAPAHTPLVIVGETGTGKTTLAEWIHQRSGRSGPFRARTAGEFDPGLERDQLFGHERGAFTGAASRFVGVLEETAEGTLLLDDCHHLAVPSQLLLLRAVDRWAFRSVGGSRDLAVRCRLIVGIGEALDLLVRQGTLLPELRFRLGYSVLQVPRLSERREDIAALARGFLARCPAETGVSGPTEIDYGLLGLLEVADWPGNVRQLGMVIREGYLRAHGCPVLAFEHVTDLVTLPISFQRRGDAGANQRAVDLALRASGGNAAAAAKVLGAARSTVYCYRDRACGGKERSA